MNRLAVYYGSATPADPCSIETAHGAGRAFAAWGLVHGGRRLGLMAAAA